MSCRREHDRAGLLVGALAGGFAMYRANGSILQVLIAAAVGACVGVVGSRAPDWIEPATHGWHRRFFHSWAWIRYAGMPAISLLAIWCGRARRRRLPLVTGLLEAVAIGASAGFVGGYASHLALDWRTPRSLPMVGLG
jgi:hypothetical protein